MTINLLQKFCTPLMLEVFVALIFTNAKYNFHHPVVHTPFTGTGEPEGAIADEESRLELLSA